MNRAAAPGNGLLLRAFVQADQVLHRVHLGSEPARRSPKKTASAITGVTGPGHDRPPLGRLGADASRHHLSRTASQKAAPPRCERFEAAGAPVVVGHFPWTIRGHSDFPSSVLIEFRRGA